MWGLQERSQDFRGESYILFCASLKFEGVKYTSKEKLREGNVSTEAG